MCPEYFLISTEIVTAIATSRVAFTADAAKKKLEAVSAGTLSGTTALAISRVATLMTIPNADPARNRSHFEDRRDDSWLIVSAANVMDEYYHIELPSQLCPPILVAGEIITTSGHSYELASSASSSSRQTSNTTNELEYSGKMMSEEIPQIAKLDPESISEMQKLEHEMGVILLAWYQQPAELAKLNDAQIEQLQKLEKSLNTHIIAYKPSDD